MHYFQDYLIQEYKQNAWNPYLILLNACVEKSFAQTDKSLKSNVGQLQMCLL